MHPDVAHFFDEATNTFSYIVTDPATRRCALVDSVLGLPLPKFTHGIMAMGKKPCGLKHYQATERDGMVEIRAI